MSNGVQFVGVQTAARERAIADLSRSATQVALLALEACPGEATMRFVMRFGHHLQILAGLARGRPANGGVSSQEAIRQGPSPLQ
jgi:hypothetical protein